MTVDEQKMQAEIESLAAGSEMNAPEVEAALARLADGAHENCPQASAAALDLLVKIRNGGETDESLKAGLLHLQDVFRQTVLSSDDSPPPASQGLEDDPELVGDFILEAREHLVNAERNLLALEKDPHLDDAVHSVFRSFHTIKGLAGFLSFAPIHAVAHETETILHQAREKQIAITPRLIDLALKGADFIRTAVDALSRQSPQEAMASLPPFEPLLNEIASAAVVKPAAVEDRTRAPVTQQAGSPAAVKTTDASVVRVDTAKLEYLVEMTGELVIAQSLIHFSPGGDTGATAQSRNFAHLGRVTAEIQKTVLSMRMVPIAGLYDRMARLVRDLGRKAGKRIELRRIGDQVELDRNIVEEITDPFVHMIRNSVDHGIEDAATRLAAGKSETAFVTLEAFHQAGYIILRLSDDGRGLRIDRILAKAIERGLVSPDARLDEVAICKLIFEPGFSTADKVTDISGRGVGMDVVRKQIEKLRGSVEIQSTAGVGCAFTIKLPLTLAMVDGLILEAGGERYVLPIYSVREMFHITPEKLFTVENRAEMVLLRGSLLPLVRLDRFFANAPDAPGQGEIGIVVEGRTRHFCLVVDRMIGKQEVVIKALGPSLRSVKGVAGGAILGDGRVGLILDVHGIDGGGE
ncbi:MAG TPA: chemotaxis protein CheA [Bryobacteraceae bacterium]|jgi:two-component system chemotaxis sensor kinase CheA